VNILKPIFSNNLEVTFLNHLPTSIKKKLFPRAFKNATEILKELETAIMSHKDQINREVSEYEAKLQRKLEEREKLHHKQKVHIFLHVQLLLKTD
jgi:hypothetical protein